MSEIKTRPFNALNYLNDEEDVAAYLAAVMEEGDPALLAGGIGRYCPRQGNDAIGKSHRAVS